MTLLNYILLVLLPLAGGLAALGLRKLNPLYLKLLLSFSGAYLFGITILHLIPEVFAGEARWGGMFILAGFLIQVALDQFSQGVEHGHIHEHQKLNAGYVWSIMAGLSVHAFIEGIPLSDIHHHAGHMHGVSFDLQPLLYGIAIHKIPAAFALMSIFLIAKVPLRNAFILLLVFSLVTPFASILTNSLTEQSWMTDHNLVIALLAIVVGSFLHISTTILFEVGTKVHNFNFIRFGAILLGIAMAVLTVS